MDISLQTHQSYIGKSVHDLPTPALVLSKSVIEKNVNRLHEDVEKLGIGFRPHVKTLKTIEATRIMLANGKYRKIVASTLCEIRGCLPLVKEGILDECLYGLPVRPSVLNDLNAFTTQHNLKIVLMVDHPDHIRILDEFNTRTGRTAPWPAFIKVDVGTNRAGIMNSSPRLDQVIQSANASAAVSIYGFYCHAGHSYASKTTDQAVKVLEEELNGVLMASEKLVDRSKTEEIILSIGATPTAHVVANLKQNLPANTNLELHAGNFPANDLQQVATGLVSFDDQAVRVVAEVCSVYPERNEALINAGVIALTKEASSFSGLARWTDGIDWSIVRVSQEHGIFGWVGEESKKEKVENKFHVGQKVSLYTQHACITSAMYYVMYVVDEQDIVRETWIPWKGW
ncbi:putative serine dehydratase domain-containing protein [Talaromyces proteolyticus]|uniref:D-serine dehydratase n=1 Tax=Talaromyces proteolyticus TaxID=1131652 RepID=A0AAD4Q3D1_9EURO|nr:putative serine dehydratase domain-containing protein [Talaromyces proteolyticus]KAH8701617.1 putative serine dehydratase domain-containing protein [Talaromyces proteolyticus]